MVAEPVRVWSLTDQGGTRLQQMRRGSPSSVLSGPSMGGTPSPLVEGFSWGGPVWWWVGSPGYGLT
ncbi:hypothetical protein FGK60_22010 [Streptomyces sp. DASNCL29]|nr:hypothetical protein FGK60_22010 [Streptomyces sp. DASNCL29]